MRVRLDPNSGEPLGLQLTRQIRLAVATGALEPGERMPSARDLAAKLAVEGEGPVERLVVIDIAAIDWNCPKYILPRFTEAEIQAMLAPRFAELTRENDALRARIAELEAGQG